MKKILRLSTHLLLAMAIAVAGCTSSYEDQVTPDDTLTPEEEGTLVSFSLDVADMEGDDDATRAASSYESSIANLWILQFDSSGDRVWTKYITSSLSSSFSLTIYPTASTLVFVANTGDDTFGNSYSTLTALKDATYDIAEHDDVLNDSYCIMSGSLLVSEISTSETNPVTLKRNAAKVNVKIENNLSGDEWELLSIKTLNIQTKSYYYTNYTLSTYFPFTSSAVDYTWTSDEVTAGTGSSGLTFYLPINKRGTQGSNTSESDKSKNALAGATAIKVYFYSKSDPFTIISFTFYLGANMITDYNLLGNYLYSCTFTLSGIGIADSRVELHELEDLCVFEESDISNCYILNPTSSTQEFYIPIEGRINTFWGDQGYEYDIDNMLMSGDDWEVDILWNDISSDISNFKVERVITTSDMLTPGGNAIAGSSALKVTLPSSFNTSDHSMHGNIAVGIRNTDYSSDQDNYLWSWHFWITDYNPDGTRYSSSSHGYAGEYVWTVTGGEVVRLEDNSSYPIWSNDYLGKYMMDRPLGSITNQPIDHTDNRGVLYYQYGRKDPFTLWPSGTYTTDNISGNTTSVGTVQNAVLNPTKFSLYSVLLNDSAYDSKFYLWNDKLKTVTNYSYYITSNIGGKSIFDPSPLGWKIPHRYAWANSMNLSNSYLSLTSTNYSAIIGGAYIGASNATSSSSYYVWYPAAGMIDPDDGRINNSNFAGYFWSCSYYYFIYFYDLTNPGDPPDNNGYAIYVVPIQE